MRTLFRALVALLLSASIGFAQQNSGPPPTTVGTALPGQIPGTATNDSAAAGDVGEFTSANTFPQSATVTFTNGSADITWTNNLAVGQVASFSTTGALPTNFVAGTTYYVIATSLSGSNVEVSATPGGVAITAGSAGSGTQTGTRGATLVTATPTDAAYVSLTPGDWDVTAMAIFAPAGTTSITLSGVGTGTTSNAAPANNNGNGFVIQTAAQVPGGGTFDVMAPTSRKLVSATQNIFCTVTATFIISTMTAGCFIRARRVR